MRLLILNGPNLNWLGRREPSVYGSETFEDILVELKNNFQNIDIEYIQSNVEGELINHLQHAENNEAINGVIFNAGGYTHTSIALADTLKAMKKNVVLVHLSNIYSRETERHTDLLLANANGCILGFGKQSYSLAIHWFIGL
jgi:3-dehydroquinate dehydratase-2